MKEFIIVSLILFSGCSSGTRPTKKERDILFNECITETNVDPDIAKSYREYNFTNEDPIGQCFVKCICLKEGLCDAEHLKIITTTIEESVPPMAQKMIRDNGAACSEEVGNDDCNSIFIRFRCFNNAIPRFARNLLSDIGIYLF